MNLFDQKSPGIMALLMQDFPPLTVEDAAAVLGNFGEETGGFALMQEQSPLGGGAGGWGWAQWTGPRRQQFEDYCTRNNLDPSSDKANYGWLFNELNGPYKHVLPAVREAISVADKTAAFMNTYEMPNAAYAHLDVRINYANQAIAAYRNAPQPVAPILSMVPRPTTTPAPTTTPTPTTTKPPPLPTTTPAPTKGPSMFNIGTLISLIGSAPSIIQGVMTLIGEVEKGYAQGKAAGGDPVVIFEDILAQLVANKGAVAAAVLGPEPTVSANGAVVPAPKVTVVAPK